MAFPLIRAIRVIRGFLFMPCASNYCALVASAVRNCKGGRGAHATGVLKALHCQPGLRNPFCGDGGCDVCRRSRATRTRTTCRQTDALVVARASPRTVTCTRLPNQE